MQSGKLNLTEAAFYTQICEKNHKNKGTLVHDNCYICVSFRELRQKMIILKLKEKVRMSTQ